MTKTIEGLAFARTLIQQMSGYEVQSFRLTFHEGIPHAKKSAEGFVRGHQEGRRKHGRILMAKTTDSLDIEASREIMDMLLKGPLSGGIKAIEHLPRT